jgi:hypothetical protein
MNSDDNKIRNLFNELFSNINLNILKPDTLEYNELQAIKNLMNSSYNTQDMLNEITKFLNSQFTKQEIIEIYKSIGIIKSSVSYSSYKNIDTSLMRSLDQSSYFNNSNFTNETFSLPTNNIILNSLNGFTKDLLTSSSNNDSSNLLSLLNIKNQATNFLPYQVTQTNFEIGNQYKISSNKITNEEPYNQYQIINNQNDQQNSNLNQSFSMTNDKLENSNLNQSFSMTNDKLQNSNLNQSFSMTNDQNTNLNQTFNNQNDQNSNLNQIFSMTNEQQSQYNSQQQNQDFKILNQDYLLPISGNTVDFSSYDDIKNIPYHFLNHDLNNNTFVKSSSNNFIDNVNKNVEKQLIDLKKEIETIKARSDLDCNEKINNIKNELNEDIRKITNNSNNTIKRYKELLFNYLLKNQIITQIEVDNINKKLLNGDVDINTILSYLERKKELSKNIIDYGQIYNTNWNTPLPRPPVCIKDNINIDNYDNYSKF